MDNLTGFFLQLAAGAWVTIQVAVCALLLGLVLGLLGAVGESSRCKFVRMAVTSLVSLCRGLPELLVIFLVYFSGTLLLNHLFHHYVDVPAFLSGVIALALIFGAYTSQVFRGAFLAIPAGQAEAARALGLGRGQIFFHIQLPQAWRIALPGLSNCWLVLLKDTALVSLIGLADLMNKAQLAASSTHKPFVFFLSVALWYLLMTSVSQSLLKKLNERANRHLVT
jgi:His/Glu/Gln/Arg/opine family amino acid ABC transporter permease subunit